MVSDQAMIGAREAVREAADPAKVEPRILEAARIPNALVDREAVAGRLRVRALEAAMQIAGVHGPSTRVFRPEEIVASARKIEAYLKGDDA